MLFKYIYLKLQPVKLNYFMWYLSTSLFHQPTYIGANLKHVLWKQIISTIKQSIFNNKTGENTTLKSKKIYFLQVQKRNLDKKKHQSNRIGCI